MPTDHLVHYIRTYDDDLDAALCQQLIGSFQSLERFHKLNGRNTRAGLEDSAWTELNVTRLADPEFLAMFRRFIDHALNRYNKDIGLSIEIPNSPLISDLVMKRYRPNSEE